MSAERDPQAKPENADNRPTPEHMAALRRLAVAEPVLFSLAPLDALCVVSTLQVALRHPDNVGPAAQKATQLAWWLRDELVSRAPGISSMIDAGWGAVPAARKNG